MKQLCQQWPKISLHVTLTFIGGLSRSARYSFLDLKRGAGLIDGSVWKIIERETSRIRGSQFNEGFRVSFVAHLSG